MKMLVLHKIKKVLRDERKWLATAKTQLRRFKLQRIFDAVAEVTKLDKVRRLVVHPRLLSGAFRAILQVPREEGRVCDELACRHAQQKALTALQRY